MKYSLQDKLRIINLVKESEKPTRSVLKHLGINNSTYYKWYKRYCESGPDGLKNIKPTPKKFWNSLSNKERSNIIQLAITHPEKAPKDIAREFLNIYGAFISESSVYRILDNYDYLDNRKIVIIKGRERLTTLSNKVNEIWTTEFIFIKLIGWGYYYLSVLFDDYSKYAINWKLFTVLSKNDTEQLVNTALWNSGLKKIRVKYQARLLTGNSSKLFIDRLKGFLYDFDLKNIHGNSSNARFVRKIDGTVQPKKNIIYLNNYYLPGDLENQIQRFIDYYNNECYLKAFNNLTPSNIYHGKNKTIQQQRQKIKEKTLLMRKIRNLGLEA
jgi:transposase-like protein